MRDNVGSQSAPAGGSRSLALVEVLERRCLLSAGQLDPTFGSGGAAYGEMFPGGAANAMAVLPDGKILVAGGATFEGIGAVALARFNPNGSVDRTFGTAGRVVTALGDPTEVATAMTVLPDGKILVAGYSGNVDSNTQILNSHAVVLRYLPTGKLDLNFASHGIDTLGTLGDVRLNGMAVRPDGKILIAGARMDASGHQRFLLARLTAGGALDPTFAGGGKVLTDFPGAGGAAQSLAIQSDGRIVLAGEADNGAGNLVIALARYQPNGATDPTFAGGMGKLSVAGVEIGGTYDLSDPIPIALQADGKILAAGPDISNSGLDVVRITSSGSLDHTFGSSGIASYDSNGSDTANRILVGRDGKIVVVGSHSYEDSGYGPTPFNSEVQVVRFSASGAPLASFGTTPVGSGGGNDAAMLGDGKLLVAGWSAIGSSGGDLALFRYKPDGSLDSSFGNLGIVQQPNGLTGLINSIAVQGDGKIVVAGSEPLVAPDAFTDQSTGPQLAALARYTSNGRLDTSFGSDGRVFLQIGNVAKFDAVVVQLNGDILAVGDATINGRGLVAIARYLPGGQPDPSFGRGGVSVSRFDAGILTASIRPDGSIVLVGMAPDTLQPVITRFLPGGAPDRHFGSNGQLVFPQVLDQYAPQVGLAFQRSGRILVGIPDSGVTGVGIPSAGVIGLQPNGTIDTSFGTHGIVPVNTYDVALAVDSSDDVLVAGAPGFGTGGIHLARLLPNGAPDPSFGDGGSLDSPFPTVFSVNSLALDQQGGILVGLNSDSGPFIPGLGGAVAGGVTVRPFLGGSPPVQYSAVARFVPNGNGLDPNFGTYGVTRLDSGTEWNVTNTVISVLSDGRILAADLDLFRLSAR